MLQEPLRTLWTNYTTHMYTYSEKNNNNKKLDLELDDLKRSIT